MAEIQANASKIDSPSEDAKQARREELVRKAGRFRILIVGRANAGKTTILKRICNTTENPTIYNREGTKVSMRRRAIERIDTSTIEPTSARGIHDIENEMIFRSNPGFIFHDSRGFEAGGVDELQQVRSFLAARSRKKKLEDQIHIIWYCIPVDDDRPITYADRQFFSEIGTGQVPMIAVFTKCEALERQAIEVLQDEQRLSFGDAFVQAPKYAQKHLQIIHLDLEEHKYPPKDHVYLQEMDNEGADCTPLVDCTASVLDGNTLQAIFVSTQQASVEICIKYAIK